MANPVVRETLALRDRRRRQEKNSFLIEGPHLIESAVTSGAAIEKVFLTASFASRKEGRRILGLLSGRKVRIFEVSDAVLHKLTDTETPQGIAAVVSCGSLRLAALRLHRTPLIVVADAVQDPGNLGTIIRTSDASGADAVILLPGTCDAYGEKTIRSTAGSIFTIPVVSSDAESLMKWLSSKRIKLAVTSGHAEKTLFETDLTGPVAFVFGNEARGVSKEIAEKSALTLKIPIYGKAESLNVAASAAVCLYEAVRQRTEKRERLSIS